MVNLPDFYGPEVHTATLQQTLAQAVEGKTVNWVGSLDTAREHVYVPDAMKAVAQLAFHEEVYGKHWFVPGAGPISLRRVLAISEQRLGRRIPARASSAWTLRLLSLWVGGYARSCRWCLPTWTLLALTGPSFAASLASRRSLHTSAVFRKRWTGLPAQARWRAERMHQSMVSAVSCAR